MKHKLNESGDKLSPCNTAFSIVIFGVIKLKGGNVYLISLQRFIIKFIISSGKWWNLRTDDNNNNNNNNNNDNNDTNDK